MAPLSCTCLIPSLKIPIITPGLIFVQKAFFARLILGGASHWKEFCVSKWVGLDSKNCSKQPKTATPISPWAYIREGLLSEGFLRLRCRWLIFGRAYFRRGLLSEFYGMLNTKEFSFV